MKTWMETLNELLLNQDDKNLNQVAEDHTKASSDDVGFVNPVSGAGMLARSNGRLEGFADYGLGFRVDPSNKTFSIYGSRIHLFCSDFQVFAGEREFQVMDPEQEEILGMIGGVVDEKVQ
jgi:hypothetical protein